MSNMVKIARETAKKYGYELLFRAPENYLKSKPEEQLRIIEQLRKEAGGIQYLILHPWDAKLVAPLIHSMNGEGVKTICIDGDAKDSERLMYIGTDNKAAGVSVAEGIVKLTGGRGEVVLSTVRDTPIARTRIDAVREYLRTYPGISIADVEMNHGDVRKRAGYIQEILRKKPDIKVVAGLDLHFVKVAEVLKNDVGVDPRIGFIGFDNTDYNQAALKSGVIDILISQRQNLFGQVALKAIFDYENGKLKKTVDLLDTYQITRAGKSDMKGA
jgi:methyl-accepting chemotaxis protein